MHSKGGSTMVPTLLKLQYINFFLETLLLWIWLKYNIAAQSYYYWWTHAYRIKIIALHALVISIIIRKKDFLLPAT